MKLSSKIHNRTMKALRTDTGTLYNSLSKTSKNIVKENVKKYGARGNALNLRSYVVNEYIFRKGAK